MKPPPRAGKRITTMEELARMNSGSVTYTKADHIGPDYAPSFTHIVVPVAFVSSMHFRHVAFIISGGLWVYNRKTTEPARFESVFDLQYPSPMDAVIDRAKHMQHVEAHTGGIASHRVNGNMQSFMLEGGK